VTEEIVYRQATLSDLRPIAAMEREYFGRHAFGPGMLLYLLLHAGEGFMVAELDGKLVGYIAVRRERVRRTRAELPTFAVREDMRGRGIGSALLTRALDYLAGHGISRVELQVSVGNPRARKLYEAFGFAAQRTLANYYGRGEDGLLMVRRAKEPQDDDQRQNP
jgi:ribosomal-protein-alanine N-acetyltransferase